LERELNDLPILKELEEKRTDLLEIPGASQVEEDDPRWTSGSGVRTARVGRV
jgi:hypothetical protein